MILWSESAHFAHVRRHFFAWRGPDGHGGYFGCRFPYFSQGWQILSHVFVMCMHFELSRPCCFWFLVRYHLQVLPYSKTCVREPPLNLTLVVDVERWLSYKGTCHVILPAKLHDMYLYKTATFPHQPSLFKVCLIGGSLTQVSLYIATTAILNDGSQYFFFFFFFFFFCNLYTLKICCHIYFIVYLFFFFFFNLKSFMLPCLLPQF